MLMAIPPCYKLRKHVYTKPENKINKKFLVLCIYFYYVIFNLEKISYILLIILQTYKTDQIVKKYSYLKSLSLFICTKSR